MEKVCTSLLNYVLRVLSCLVPRFLRALMLYLPCALRAFVPPRALVPYVPRALHAVIPHVPRTLCALVPYVPRALCFVASNVLCAQSVLMPCVPRILHVFVPTCIVSYMLLYLTCLVPCAFLCPLYLLPHVPCTLCALMLYEPFFLAYP